MAKNLIVNGNSYNAVPYIAVPKADGTGDAVFGTPLTQLHQPRISLPVILHTDLTEKLVVRPLFPLFRRIPARRFCGSPKWRRKWQRTL